MKFHKLTDTCKPEIGREVLVRIDRAYNYSKNELVPVEPYYYVVIRTDIEMVPIYDEITITGYEEHDYYEEAGGEQYARWLDCTISHWCYTSDIESEIEEI